MDGIIIAVEYRVGDQQVAGSKKLKSLNIVLGLLLVGVLGFIGYLQFFQTETIEEKIENQLAFDATLSPEDVSFIEQSIAENFIEINSPVTARGELRSRVDETDDILTVLVPVTNFNSVMQATSDEELGTSNFSALDSLPSQDVELLAEHFQTDVSRLESDTELPIEEVSFIPASALTYDSKLLAYNDSYYLDDFISGALFKVVVFEGEGAGDLDSLDLNDDLNANGVLKVNMTGVTALTREMQKKLAVVKDPLYFSEKIGDFLSDADLTHVSNEVSFLEPCSYSRTLFCSHPEFIETLKASGVDIVELTGNHNNDLGAQANTDTINQYHELGWATIGGGLNSEEAAKPYIADQEGSKIAFLAYNYPDSPNGGAIAGPKKAGANPFDFAYESLKTDIESAKQSSDFVIVNVQYWECYAYPNGYIEYPECDLPVGEQEAVFKAIVDAGADMVIGSSAHQPQTYELYQGKPIYYGLGNLYFEQTQWPGTERGLVLTNYFKNGTLLQTKITPTIYDKDLQTRVMTAEETEYILTRLHDARE